MVSRYCSRGHENTADSRFCRQCGEQLSPHLTPIAGSGIAGSTLSSRYRLLRELGQGGFGRTYLAEDTNRFNELCVLKEFAPQVQGDQALQKAEELFAREAGILYKLQHPQIPRFRELFRAELQGQGRLFLVQDYVEGQTYQAILRTRWSQGHYFTEAEVTQLLHQLLPVLSYIHGLGVIHRDISPDNLILRNADGLPVLIDFGGVKQVAAEVMSQVNPTGALKPQTGVTLLGKVGYSPQEQMSTGAVFPHSDLYALAVTVLVLLTGKEPQLLLVGNQRHWQREVALSQSLMFVLDRMLDPYPANRFQSAVEVLQALGVVPARDRGITQPPIEAMPAYGMYPATIAVGPQVPDATHIPTVSHPVVPPRRSGWNNILPVVLIVGLLGIGGWAGSRWLLPLLPLSQSNQPDNPSPKPLPTTDNTQPEPTLPKAEQERKQALNKRREALGVDNTFFNSLVNQVFYTKHPELSGRQLSPGTEDESLRADWDSMAAALLEQLQVISPESRSRMGRYGDSDIQARQAAVNQLRLSSRALNDLTDAQFAYLFPGQADPNRLKQPFGQVWQAIATDQLKALQSDGALRTIQFSEGRFSEQISGNLQPGQGRAYTAQLSKDQKIRLRVQADGQAVRLSFYPPTSKSPALLEDSTQTEWSGQLSESGLYEVVIVSTAAQPIGYELDLAAADDVTPNSTPPVETTPKSNQPEAGT